MQTHYILDIRHVCPGYVMPKSAATSKTPEILEIPATITERGQTTVPAAIRKMLALQKRDRVVFRGLADGTVVIARREPPGRNGDPVIGRFLDFLANDMTKQPQRIQPVSSDLIKRGKVLVKGVRVDLEQALPTDDT